MEVVKGNHGDISLPVLRVSDQDRTKSRRKDYIRTCKDVFDKVRELVEVH